MRRGIDASRRREREREGERKRDVKGQPEERKGDESRSISTRLVCELDVLEDVVLRHRWTSL